MKKFLLILFLFVVSFLSVRSQIITIKDKSSSTPISNVTISSPTDQKFQITDENGTADISGFPGSSQLEFRHPAYLTITLTKKDLLENGLKVLMEQKYIPMDELIISANKWEQKKEEIPHEIFAIKPETAAFNNPQTAADLLEGTGKVFVQKSQQGGGSPMIRGFGANAVLIVVDGVRMNNAIFRGGNLQNILNVDPNMLEGSEVISGPGSVMYGSDALGGVMDFHTTKINLENQKSTNSTAFLRFSSTNKERTGHINWTISGKKVGWFGGITLSKYGELRAGANRPKGYPEIGKRNFYVERMDGQDSIVTNKNPNIQVPSSFSQMNTLQKFKWKLNSKISLEYIFNLSTTSDVPRYDRLIEVDDEGLPVNAEWYYGPQFWMMNALKMNVESTRFWEELTLTLSYQEFKESRHDRKFQRDDLRSRNEKVNVYALNLDACKSWKRQDIFYGLEATFNQVNSNAFSQNIETGIYSPLSTRYPDGGSNTHTFAMYVNTKRELVPSSLFANAGLRFTANNLNATINEGGFPYTNITIDNEAVVGNLGLVWKPAPKLRWSVLGSSGFRSPNVDDIAKVFDSEPGMVIVPNPDLKPEYSYNLETGIHWIPFKNFSFESNIFYSWLRDAMVRTDFTFNGEDSILYDGELSKVQAWANTGKAVIYGIDAMIDFKIKKNWHINSYLNYMQGRDLYTNESLRHVTPLFGITSLIFQREKWKLEFYSRYNGKILFEYLPPSEQNKPQLYSEDGALAWYTLNVRGEYSLSEHVGVNLSIENFLDKNYQTYSSGISAPGFNAIISLRATL